ncbi:MAG: hypothetical protein M1402_03775 [Candidatus Thermoplasmatota archaeon]|nr:hypothetical protein [Candidatus Thermoplasmatota archaeon]MCL5665254.1 hypothetical protein [Candidatus Thermoplasmatota archaeon]
MTLGIYWIANISILGIEAVLLALIIGVYVRTRISSGFSSITSIILFSMFFLAQSIASIYEYFTMAFIYPSSLAIILLFTNTIGLAAFGTLFFSLNR